MIVALFFTAMPRLVTKAAFSWIPAVLVVNLSTRAWRSRTDSELRRPASEMSCAAFWISVMARLCSSMPPFVSAENSETRCMASEMEPTRALISLDE